jgi:hypothetical protein
MNQKVDSSTGTRFLHRQLHTIGFSKKRHKNKFYLMLSELPVRYYILLLPVPFVLDISHKNSNTGSSLKFTRWRTDRAINGQVNASQKGQANQRGTDLATFSKTFCFWYHHTGTTRT